MLSLRFLLRDPIVNEPDHPVFRVVIEREDNVLLLVSRPDETGVAAEGIAELVVVMNSRRSKKSMSVASSNEHLDDDDDDDDPWDNEFLLLLWKL